MLCRAVFGGVWGRNLVPALHCDREWLFMNCIWPQTCSPTLTLTLQVKKSQEAMLTQTTRPFLFKVFLHIPWAKPLFTYSTAPNPPNMTPNAPTSHIPPLPLLSTCPPIHLHTRLLNPTKHPVRKNRRVPPIRPQYPPRQPTDLPMPFFSASPLVPIPNSPPPIFRNPPPSTPESSID